MDCRIIIIMSIYQSYELYEIIGHGASCTVKRAVRKDSRQVFAAKLYQTDFLSAKNQIQLLIRLDHPNIVNIYEVFEEYDCIILILEYMSGGELYEIVGQKKCFTQGEVRYAYSNPGINTIKQYMKILVDCIRYCHQMKVVHRDIKPQNLLLTANSPQGILKLADFGISKIMSDTILTTNCGTPVYMAPQIWKGQPYDQKVDVWSIGIVMYYLLSGTHPFFGQTENIGEIIMDKQLSFEQQIWNVITSGAINLLRKLLQKDPRKRPSAQEVSTHLWFTQLQTFAQGTDVQETTVVLHQSVHKIRRFNFKQKQKKARKKLQLVRKAESLSDARLDFLTYDSTSDSASEYTQLTKRNSSLMIEQQDDQT